MNQLRRLLSWMRAEKRIIYFEYGLLALAIMLPLLLPGFILTLDLVFTPNIAFPSELTNAYPLHIVLWALNLVLPGEIIEKLLLLTILIASGTGAHRLVRTIPPGKLIAPEYLRWGAYVGGIFYMINPFTYSRFMAGQWQVLLGYALLPIFVLQFIRFIAKPSRRTALLVALWAAIISALSIHHLGMLLIIGAVAGGLSLWRYWGTAQLKKILGWGLASIAALVVMSSYWLVPALTGNSSITSTTESFDKSHHEAFATSDEGAFGAVGNVIRLQGFWVEERALYILPQDRLPAWGLVAIAIWALIGCGVVAAWRGQRFMALLFGAVGLLGIILAATPLLSSLSDLLPFVDGYREPHKFVTLIALAYVYFAAIGTAWLLQLAHQKWGEGSVSTLLVILLLLPIAFTPTMLWGFSRQLAPRDYPADWYAVNEKMNQAEKGGKALFLPWHQYMKFEFADRIIANPADKFFDKKVVVSDDPEFKDIRPTHPDNEKQDIGRALNNPKTLPTALAKHGIRYILLAKEQDFDKYKYLDTLPELQVISDTQTLKLYENKAYRP